MRCFLALDLPLEVKAYLSEMQKKLHDQNVMASWVKQDTMHLTLKFFGEISDIEVNNIKNLFRDFTFDLGEAHLGTIGFFPSESYVRVLWISLEPSAKIKELHDKVDALLEKSFKKDKQFESHITLARIKFLKDKEEFIAKARGLEIKPLSFDVNSLFLKKSTLTPQGSIYESIAQFNLS